MKIVVDSNGRVSLFQFIDLLDTTKVVYYSVETDADMVVSLKFYDRNRKPIELYDEVKTSQDRTPAAPRRTKKHKVRNKASSKATNPRRKVASSVD